MSIQKKLSTLLLVVFLAAAAVTGCSDDKDAGSAPLVEKIPEEELMAARAEKEAQQQQQQVQVPETETVTEEEPELMEVPEGMYLSELTGLPIDEAIRDQRPVAVMIDNEKIALNHYETAESDIVYEMMNSVANDHVTRLMCIRKDWKSINQMGSIRSTRPTNIPLAAEYNAVLVHDGGPFYINEWLARNYARHLSGGFARIPNGKSYEFTEYVTTGELSKRMASAGYSETYDSYRPERDTHFIFGDYGTDMTPSERGLTQTQAATDIRIPFFKHNSSELKYNESTGTYDYYEYGSRHIDGEDNEPLTFKNVILQDMDYHQLDENGYLTYYMINTGDPQPGLYITNGEAVNITWLKDSETSITKFYDETGNEIVINPGKTYIGLVPKSGWKDVTLR